MPSVTSLEALERAAAEFEVGGAQLVIEPPALTAARRFSPRMPRVNVWRSQIRLRQQRGHLVLDLPDASEATVPQRPIPLPDFHG
jgi:hypothetical protein